MSKKTIKQMRRPQLIQLIEETIDNINSINSLLSDIENKNTEINQHNEEIIKDGGTLEKINNAKKESEEKLNLILEFYNKVYEKNEENDSIKNQLEKLLDYYQKSKEKIKNFRKEIFGGKVSNEDGEEEELIGLKKQIEDFYSEQQERYRDIYQRIEEELKGGATTMNLTKAFADKVDEYKKLSNIWSWWIILLLVAMTIYYGYSTWDIEAINTLEEAFKNIIYRVPFLAFVIWLGIFFTNRRAESKKLEESYKHKEVMARSFVGYKGMIEKIEGDDKVLLKKHMDNLLSAINIDSSLFLETKGEDYPLSSWLGLKKKEKIEVKNKK